MLIPAKLQNIFNTAILYSFEPLVNYFYYRIKINYIVPFFFYITFVIPYFNFQLWQNTRNYLK